MDYLKTRAPFWKQEERGGETDWVEARVSDDHGGGALAKIMTPAWLWAVFTVFAAGGQTARNAMQRELTATSRRRRRDACAFSVRISIRTRISLPAR